MDHLIARIETLEQHVQALTQQTTSVARRLRWWRRLAFVLMVLSLFSLSRSLGEAQPDRPPGPADRGLAQRVRALEQKLQHVTSEKGPEGFPELVITGANVRIVNGLNSTDCTDEQGNPIPDCPNGLGNLIVGYNEPRVTNPETPEEPARNVRTGSHNVVVGQAHNFSRFGGLVIGLGNEISGDFSSVSGGAGNTASGVRASVSGGSSNTASGSHASVTGGGFANRATGSLSVVSGGSFNEASGVRAVVSGGIQNQAIGDEAVVSGGQGNLASGAQAVVTGGHFNQASGPRGVVTGGDNNQAGSLAVVSGGHQNVASGGFSVVSGGTFRIAEGEGDWVAGDLFQDR
jgi:hypothetical protein